MCANKFIFRRNSTDLRRYSNQPVWHLKLRGTGQALDSLGQLTYAQGRYEEAQAFFLEAASQFEEMGDSMSLSRVLCHQGFNLPALQKWVDARIAFQNALNIAQQGGIIPVVLNALVGLAAIQAQQESSGRILALILFILAHPSSIQEVKELAEQLKLEVESRLSPAEIEAAQVAAGSKKLDEFVYQALHIVDLK